VAPDAGAADFSTFHGAASDDVTRTVFVY